MISFFIRTYGCQANVADSQAIANHLKSFGCSEVALESAADIILINTCAVRDKAEQKLWSYIGKLAVHKRAKPFVKIGIIGCVASYKKQEMYRRFDHVSFVYGAREEAAVFYAYLADIVVQVETAKQLYQRDPESPLLCTGQDRDVATIVGRKRLSVRNCFRQPELLRLVGSQGKEVGRSFINIMTGCNKYCSYCIVPFTRGPEISYPMSRIVEQAQHSIAQGAKEITLIGQNVNSYIDPETNAKFPELLRRIASMEGDFWIRFISPHPQDMTCDLFDVMAEHRPKITASVHFPLQSGSNKILAAMNRNYTIQEYEEKIGWIRARMPDATISTDIIVGFPGETESEFQETLSVLERIRYDLVYSFIYSPRKFTKASSLADDCSAAIKTERLETLQRIQTEIALERNSINIGKTLVCLVEKRLENDKLLARTEGNIRVLFDGTDDYIGTFQKLYIESSGPANMSAMVVQSQGFEICK